MLYAPAPKTRISPDRREVLEAFLDAQDGDLTGVYSLKRRR
jgi:hypothetical protein